ncbi:anthrone oxygenase tpcL [Aspergillus homomorphus CBS 101889]|uniref:DUF1772-domain-containing protein n=1 Tax=Aspergillus homomorphus (strain CBS 101889) TaxID=1450537 RepID=A0A395HXX4_ASPHC|nr:DUF1772-domain-containing protein [Aspergillus homomorphus CBS 101889]RAL12376.1 DUF1772-domain-containing protein [Aspergillus homomorphus CBS 101889]
MPHGTSFSPILPHASAVITGSFLSGTMMGLSLITVPVLLETATQPSYLLQHFVRLYDVGHKMMPGLAVTTCFFYGIAAAGQRASARSALPQLVAGLTTIAIVPFTWLVMTPTNDALFQLQADAGAARLGEVRQLLVRWGWLHAMRSCFPLMGAVLGLRYLLRELGW